ncbi:Serine-arginine protein 55 [Portunus trituberculatus]|uniref:Serine-arginine protein 55 n=1 Tax=Portunus trituberculatus TaxID=210409 RepID=A0A5B7E4K2_PORTR|nr:Serine-arginine protein 55 [Portunus trituberculatus]
MAGGSGGTRGSPCESWGRLHRDGCRSAAAAARVERVDESWAGEDVGEIFPETYLGCEERPSVCLSGWPGAETTAVWPPFPSPRPLAGSELGATLASRPGLAASGFWSPCPERLAGFVGSRAAEARLKGSVGSTLFALEDLKDFMRQAGEVTYADAHKYRRNEGSRSRSASPEKRKSRSRSKSAEAESESEEEK